VEASNNGLDYSSEGPSFLYTPDIVLLDASPRSGPVSGGTLVRVAGKGLLEAINASAMLSCAFGEQMVAATLEGDHLNCYAPPGMEGAVRVPLRLTSNGVDVTEVRSHFLYYGESLVMIRRNACV
jgi:hypothetical protein